MSEAPPVMLFDGVCNLCNASVNFVLDRDRDARLRFASLQSESGRGLLAARGVALPEGDPDSMVLVEGDRVWVRSRARVKSRSGASGDSGASARARSMSRSARS